MPREATTAVLNQLQGASLRPAIFLEIQFQNDTVRAWSGIGVKSAPGPAADPNATFPYGQPFIGVGWLGQIRTVPMASDVVALNVTLELSGIPTELLSDAINAVRLTGIATLWFGTLDQTGAIIGDPVQIFQGSTDVPTLIEGADTCTLQITCENELIDLNRAPGGRYTDVDQQQRYPGDIGFAQVQLLQDYLIVWPIPAGDQETGTTPPPFFMVVTPGQDGPVVIGVGSQTQLTAKVTRSDGSVIEVIGQNPVYGGAAGANYSSDPSVATIDPGVSGMLTGVTPGMCIITFRFCQGLGLGGGTTNQQSQTITASITVIVTEAP